jgi:dihydrofolate reductase
LVEADIEGDAFFPKWDDNQWRVIKEESHQADDKHYYAYKFITLQRNR